MRQKRKLFSNMKPLSRMPYKSAMKYGGPIKGRTTTKRGFAPKSFESDAKLKNHIENLKKESIKKHPNPSFDNVHKFIADTKQRRDFRIKTEVGVNFHVGKITPPAGLGQEEDGKHIHITHDVNVKSIVLGSDPIHVYQRKIETGVPAAKSLLEVAKENGTTTEVLFDTKTSFEDDTEFLSRKQLTFGTGFNQKGLTVFGDNSYVSYNDIRRLVMGDTAAEGMPLSKLQKVLASFLTSRTEIALRNQSAFMRAYVKVHLVTHKPGVSAFFSPIEDLSTNVFYSNLSSSDSTTQRTKVPLAFQYTPVLVESAGTNENSAPNNALHVDFAPDINILNYSPYFKDHFEIVGSVGQMLGPGDFLNFSHVHHFGQGFDISKLYAAAPTSILMENLRNRQTSYFYMIEYRGYPCEVTYNRGGNYEHHLGSSPVILSSELRKKVVFCNTDRSTEDLDVAGVGRRVHMRVFDIQDQKIDVNRKKFNLNLTDWVSTPTPVDTKYVIQVATDRTLQASTNAAGNTNATDIAP